MTGLSARGPLLLVSPAGDLFELVDNEGVTIGSRPVLTGLRIGMGS